MLTDQQRHALIQKYEEEEFEKLLRRPRGRLEAVRVFLSSPLGLWLLSAVFLSGMGALYQTVTDWRRESDQATQCLELLRHELIERREQMYFYGGRFSSQSALETVLRKSSSDHARAFLYRLDRASGAELSVFANMSLPELLRTVKRFSTPPARSEDVNTLEKTLSFSMTLVEHLGIPPKKISDDEIGTLAYTMMEIYRDFDGLTSDMLARVDFRSSGIGNCARAQGG